MENQNRSIAFSWIVPSAILMIVVLTMLFSFSLKSSSEATEAVSKNLIEATEQYSNKCWVEFNSLKAVAQPIKKLLEKEGIQDKKYVAELTDVLASGSSAGKVYFCDKTGQGIDQSGEDISLADKEYFQTILSSSGTSYIYTDEETDVAAKVIVVAEPVVTSNNDEGYLLMYYSLDKFSNLLSKSDLEVNAFLALVDSEGKIIGTSGAKSGILESGNLVEAVESEDKEAAKTIRNRMKNGARGSSAVTVAGQSYTLVYIPFGINQWEMFLGVSQAYVDRQVDLQWERTKSMLTALIAVIFIFICIVMVVNIIGKIRRTEKEKQLEDKADTDLLTGLNNKLATERKIKEYMLQNPQSQSMMFLLDIDNFKKINDTMGHAFGDEVLRSLGQQIGVIFRASDIIGRIGGDEFMIFLKGISDEESIRKEAKKVETFFKGFQAGEYVKYAATASIGVAIFPQEGSDFETLYKAADQGLYKAKKRGKNQLAFYRDEWAQPKNGET